MSGALLDRVRGTREDADDTVRQILAAAVATFQSLGIRRTTMEDIARAAKLGRATVYRRFPQKSDLVRAALLHELRRFLDDLDDSIAAAPTVRARVELGFVNGVRGVRRHPLLSRLLATEPNDVLPYLTLDAGAILTIAAAYLAEHLRAGIANGELTVADPDLVAELMVRLAHSLVLTPDDDRIATLARAHLTALLA
jgi:AcrR family transcriptional regulator